jgi:hypothetical protein
LAQEKLALQRKQASGKGSSAQKAETKLALDILTKHRDTILAGKSSGGKQSGVDAAWGAAATGAKPGAKAATGGTSYAAAYNYVLGLAEAQMGSYRGKAYIDKWVKARLRALGLKPAQTPRRG